MNFKQLFQNRFLMVLIAWGLSSQALGASVTPKKNKDVDVFDAPKRKATKLGALKAGTAADAVERSGMYWKIKFKGKTGFVSVMKVSRQAGSASTFAKAIRNAAQESRGTDDVAGTRARSAVMGVRGLDESDEVSGAGNVQPSLPLVYAMEDLKISKRGIDKMGELVFSEIEKRAEAQ